MKSVDGEHICNKNMDTNKKIKSTWLAEPFLKVFKASIFMLSGSIQLYSNFQFNTTCIYHKIMPFISKYTHIYSISHAFTL